MPHDPTDVIRDCGRKIKYETKKGDVYGDNRDTLILFF